MKFPIAKKRIILKTLIYVCVAIVLAAAFRTGGGSGSKNKSSEELPKPAESLVTVENEEIRQTPKDVGAEENAESDDGNGLKDTSANTSDSPKSETVNNTEAQKNVSADTQDRPTANSAKKAAADVPDNKKLSCTISIKCNTALQSAALKKEKAAILPSNGVILETKAEFEDGESVFDVLRRETKNKRIHTEFSNTPGIGSAYIEGIGNLYEQDCGELSGWMYKVNGEFPKFSCSEYKLKNGDNVEWLYTCDLGKDIGGSNLK